MTSAQETALAQLNQMRWIRDHRIAMGTWDPAGYDKLSAQILADNQARYDRLRGR